VTVFPMSFYYSLSLIPNTLYRCITFISRISLHGRVEKCLILGQRGNLQIFLERYHRYRTGIVPDTGVICHDSK
jgi:hypothetical protein